MDGRISECRWPDLPAPYDAALREATADVLLRGIRGRNRFPRARGNEKWQEHTRMRSCHVHQAGTTASSLSAEECR
jgi:hypothetical protein